MKPVPAATHALLAPVVMLMGLIWGLPRVIHKTYISSLRMSLKVFLLYHSQASMIDGSLPLQLSLEHSFGRTR